MKKKTIGDLFFAVLFVAILLAVMLATVFRQKETYTYYENRMLAEVPELTAESLIIGDYFSGLDDYLADHAFLRMTLSKLNARLDICLIHRPVVNEVVVTDDMLLGYNEFESVDADSIAEQAEYMADSLLALKELVTGYGGQYYHVAVPGQYTYFADRYPGYLNNREAYTEVELAAFTAAMESRGVELLDMSSVFREMGNPEKLYSTVDYHYSFYGGFVTYQAIMERINNTTDYDLHIYSEADYTFTELDGHYMGSRSRKILDVSWLDERLTIGMPGDDIPFVRYDSGAEVAPTVYALDTYDPTGSLLYGIYMGGDQPETLIDTSRQELPTMLIYGDSFTNAVESVIYTGFDKMYSIDLRHYKDMSLAEYIEIVQPDIVVCIRDYEVLLSTDGNGTVF